MKKLNQKLSRGSVLVFSLIILSVITVMALGIASATIVEKKMAGTTGKSMLAFQVADSGVESIIKKLNKDESIDSIGDLGDCDGFGKIKGNVSGGTYEITFFNEAGETIEDCATSISEINRIKSNGTYSSTSRAVETAWAAEETGFGTWNCQNETSGPQLSQSYLAATDGFVLVAGYTTGGFRGVFGYTDGSSDPSTLYANGYGNDVDLGYTMIMPVRKNDHWKISPTNAGSGRIDRFCWIPLGS